MTIDIINQHTVKTDDYQSEEISKKDNEYVVKETWQASEAFNVA